MAAVVRQQGRDGDPVPHGGTGSSTVWMRRIGAVRKDAVRLGVPDPAVGIPVQ
ncbi:hypothetical protein [Streptomyces sp. NPDC005262]|uniref:hypothetical protein n=1 Tax=Streptomyces sp. NPDC005262 TaxID=3364710 RepID=UPI00367CCF53